jgi:hypothetical protein
MICERKHSHSCMRLLSLSLMTFSPYFTEVKIPQSIFNQISFFFFFEIFIIEFNMVSSQETEG